MPSRSRLSRCGRFSRHHSGRRTNRHSRTTCARGSVQSGFCDAADGACRKHVHGSVAESTRFATAMRQRPDTVGADKANPNYHFWDLSPALVARSYRSPTQQPSTTRARQRPILQSEVRQDGRFDGKHQLEKPAEGPWGRSFGDFGICERHKFERHLRNQRRCG